MERSIMDLPTIETRAIQEETPIIILPITIVIIAITTTTEIPILLAIPEATIATVQVEMDHSVQVALEVAIEAVAVAAVVAEAADN